ncbi:acyltransferase family protein [Sanguibacter suaedae]|uniref:Acyltransferase n=1 Tax=Sanguibacter suaedae TaxID=2795737 RepID=A0A934M9D3_9MICO|nr:acyltransferase family protein [Sanguibacter suaedae]MBI9114475.1 acyltransferase [Sanguibacter suaedae]
MTLHESTRLAHGPGPKLHRPALRADIQALRALAVGLVVLYHFWPNRLAGGFVGVDVFFVISGFLITLQIVKEADETGRIRLGRFWVRRALRLLPAALLVLGATTAATLVFFPKHLWQQTFREIGAATVYIENWVLAADSVNYMASNNTASPVQHFWTLSVEEQFYIAIPIIAALVLLSASWRRNLGALYGIVLVASLAYSVYATETAPSVAYFATTTRAWEFAAGGLLAISGSVAPARARPIAAWTGIALIVYSGIQFTAATPFPGYAAALPVLGTALVIWAHHDAGAFRRSTHLPFVQTAGNISYSIYLWHWPLIVVGGIALGRDLDAVLKLLLLVATFSLAYISTRFLENPIRFRAVRAARPRRIALASICAVMVGILAASAAGWAYVERRVEALGESADAIAIAQADPCFGAGYLVTPRCPEPTVLTPDVDVFQEDDGNRAECWGTVCTLETSGVPTKRVAVVGDSHSNALLPAYDQLPEALGWEIDVFGVGGCYLTSAKINRGNADLEEQCRAWNSTTQQTLLDGGYDAVLVTHFEGFPLHVPAGTDPRSAEIDGQVEAWTPLLDAGISVIAISDNPRFPGSTLECIAQNGLDAAQHCRTPRSEALPEVSSSEAAAQKTDALYLDLSDAYCSVDFCAPVVGGVIVLHDRDHISGSFAASLGPVIVRKLEESAI